METLGSTSREKAHESSAVSSILLWERGLDAPTAHEELGVQQQAPKWNGVAKINGLKGQSGDQNEKGRPRQEHSALVLRCRKQGRVQGQPVSMQFCTPFREGCARKERE